MTGSVIGPDSQRGRQDRVGLPAPDPEHDVGEHDREADGHHRLAQLLPLHPAKHLILQQQARATADDDEHDREGDAATSPSRSEIS